MSDTPQQDTARWDVIYSTRPDDYYADTIRVDRQSGAVELHGGGQVVRMSSIRKMVHALWDEIEKTRPSMPEVSIVSYTLTERTPNGGKGVIVLSREEFERCIAILDTEAVKHEHDCCWHAKSVCCQCSAVRDGTEHEPFKVRQT